MFRAWGWAWRGLRSALWKAEGACQRVEQGRACRTPALQQPSRKQKQGTRQLPGLRVGQRVTAAPGLVWWQPLVALGAVIRPDRGQAVGSSRASGWKTSV